MTEIMNKIDVGVVDGNALVVFNVDDSVKNENKMNNTQYASWVDVDDNDLIKAIDFITIYNKVNQNDKVRVIIQALIESIYDIEMGLNLISTKETSDILKNLLLNATPSLFSDSDVGFNTTNDIKTYNGIVMIIDAIVLNSKASYHKHYWGSVRDLLNESLPYKGY